MSNLGTAKLFDFRGVFQNLFGNNEISVKEDIDNIEKIKVENINMDKSDFEELKKSSSNRLKILEERYGIEPKKLKTKTKTPRAKATKIEKKDMNIIKEEKDIGER